MTTTNRTSDHDIDPIFLNRWSPRAFSDAALSETQVLTLIEAARWSPSASNLQPWRFFYAVKGTPEFETFKDGLIPFNHDWAQHAAALIYVGSVTTFDGERPVASHAFDAGAAWMSLALQAARDGLVAHAMGGIEHEKLRQSLSLPENIVLHCGVAVGYRGDPASLNEKLQTRETPSGRHPLSTIAFKGSYSG